MKNVEISKNLLCGDIIDFILSWGGYENGEKLDYKEPKLYDVVPKEEIAEFEEVMRETTADIVSEASSSLLWILGLKDWWQINRSCDRMKKTIWCANRNLAVR